MIIHTEEDVILLVKQDKWLMDILRTAAQLHLPDWWVCAGVVRSKFWDVLHGYQEPTPAADIDVIYFDPSNLDEENEKVLEHRLAELRPGLPWSVKNEARMHKVNNLPPYLSSVDAISKFPETATSIGISLSSVGEVLLTAPWGVQDLVHLRVKPTPFFRAAPNGAQIYEQRIAQKQWTRQWPNLSIFGMTD
ncbi:nucleotidyltransferase family protein [Paenibacillus zeisoli]|uniref:Nucleotidyltransferase family protein n=1 Tax=Paenibacillus zeisoli TaxID=2496267 RepID=A0A433XPJ7_9BACL|nr:nucleotidyltransferase family protein [Paenibacillus zeisoli]RUT35966.1 nucleotidyltransferase family protein [Paenibacillus zeisoli]